MAPEDYESEEEYASLSGTGALLNPRVDSTFKALFTQPTPESQAALRSFLEAATERKVRSFAFRNNDAPEGFAGQRGVSYDISCEFDDGLSADIEMQAFNQKYDYGKRAEYQVARLETAYMRKGDDWERASTVYQISVLDFNYRPRNAGREYRESDEPVSRYAMRTRDGRELSNALNVVFIELPKVARLEGSVETNTALENWGLFLKEADDPGKAEVIRRLTSKEDGLMQAQRALSRISANRDYWIAQYHEEVRERDRISSMNAAKREGRDEGRKEGRREGRKEGRIEGRKEGRMEGIIAGKLEVARALKRSGIDAGVIASTTGLSAEEVAGL